MCFFFHSCCKYPVCQPRRFSARSWYQVITVCTPNSDNEHITLLEQYGSLQLISIAPASSFSDLTAGGSDWSMIMIVYFHFMVQIKMQTYIRL